MAKVRTNTGFGHAMAKHKAYLAIRMLWKLRSAQGVTIGHVAEAMGRSPEYVRRKLSGPNGWTLQCVGEMAEAMGGLDIIITIERGPHDQG